jgi:ADP-heptose:LPS heptosyltransferase
MTSTIDSGRPDAARPLAVIVDREGLGDALLKLPFLRAIRRGFPDTPIWWIASHQTSMDDELKPFVSQLLARVVAHAGLTTPIRDAIPRLRTLPPFECVFDTRTRVASVLAAKLVLSHRGFYACLPGFVFSDRRPPGRWQRPLGIAERSLSMAEAALGGAAEWQGTLDVSAVARAAADARLPVGSRYVGLSTGSREARKNWPVERFITLAGALAARGLVPMFFTGPQERQQLEILRRAVPAAVFPQAEPLDDNVGVAPLEFAAALALRLSAAVANDSGLGHLLGAVGIPLVSLFGPTDPRRWAPFTSKGIVVRAQDFGGDVMDAIPVEAVVAAVERMAIRS